MRKAMITGLLLLAAGQAQADYQCGVNPQEDIVIAPQHVQVVGSNSNLIITPGGEVQYNGKAVTLSDRARQQAIDYQAALRRDLPWVDQGARQRLETGRAALDKVVVEKLGENSRVRNRLTTLDADLRKQMNRIIEHRNDGLTFHHQAIDQVRQEGKTQVQSALGGMLQDSLNEISSSQSGQSDNPLQALMGNMGGLQQAIQTEWQTQEQDFQRFGHEVCQRVTTLEAQRDTLITALK